MDPKQTIYYGVYVPNDIQLQDNEAGSRNVFFDKVEALKEVKKYKKARFKSFQFYHEALEFALHGSEFPNNNASFELNGSKSSDTTSNVGEKPSQFRGPKSQDLVKLRKSIENGDINFVKSTIWENPRYLISSGDTPAILQEGARYNALHVAAKAKNDEMCELILSTVGSADFLQLLYGEENRINSEDGSKILLDLYLNTPDKGLNETPLHFASKFGASNVVEVLVSYPQCDKNVLNKYGHKPKDMICNRVGNASKALIDKITSLLEDSFYVPVLRSEDTCIQPVIGEPFSPVNPPTLNVDPISPRLEIHAYAGPMKKEEASLFRKTWKTPPRKNYFSSNLTVPSPNFKKLPSNRTDKTNVELDIRLQDTEKGLESVGRDLAKKFNIGWKEYWPFLDTFTNFNSKEGLDSLELYLKHRFISDYSDKKQVDNHGNSNSPNSSTTMSKKLAISPISELCINFAACTLNDNNSKLDHRSQNVSNNSSRNEYVFDCFTKAGMSPYVCIEKSCQVIANRITYQIVHQMDTVTTHNVDALETEIRHLKSLICNFMDDPAFTSIINFQAVHSRISYIIAYNLQQTIFDEELDAKVKNLETIIQKYTRMVDLFSSDDEELTNCNQPRKFLRRNSTSDSKQVICLVEQILKCLENENEYEFMNANDEIECVRAWKNATPCACIWKANKSLRKGSFIKKNTINKFSSKISTSKPNQYKSMDPVSRKLNFFDEDGHEKGDGLDNVDSYNIISGKNMLNNHSKDDSSSSDSEYYSANNSLSSSDNEDLFEDVEQDEMNVFIEGNEPTKIDFSVFNAMQDVKINREQYPNIYRWRHAINGFSNEERANWPTPRSSRYRLNVNKCASTMSTPEDNSRFLFSPHRCKWMRVTGLNSPLKSMKTRKDNMNLSYDEN